MRAEQKYRTVLCCTIGTDKRAVLSVKNGSAQCLIDGRGLSPGISQQ